MPDLFAFMPIAEVTLTGIQRPDLLLLHATELVERELEDRRPHYVRGWVRADHWAARQLEGMGELRRALLEVEVAFFPVPGGLTLQAATPEVHDADGSTAALPHAVGRPLARAVLEAVAEQLRRMP